MIWTGGKPGPRSATLYLLGNGVVGLGCWVVGQWGSWVMGYLGGGVVGLLGWGVFGWWSSWVVLQLGSRVVGSWGSWVVGSWCSWVVVQLGSRVVGSWRSWVVGQLGRGVLVCQPQRLAVLLSVMHQRKLWINTSVNSGVISGARWWFGRNAVLTLNLLERRLDDQISWFCREIIAIH